MMEQWMNIAGAVLVGVACYVMWKSLMNRTGGVSQVDSELQEVLTKDEYKVKGRFGQ